MSQVSRRIIIATTPLDLDKRFLLFIVCVLNTLRSKSDATSETVGSQRNITFPRILFDDVPRSPSRIYDGTEEGRQSRIYKSVLTTLIVNGNTLGDYNKLVKPALIAPITSLRTWTFTFSFLSIGLTTRFRELATAGIKPFIAFTVGVIVNVILGYILSVIVFGHYWSSIATH